VSGTSSISAKIGAGWAALLLSIAIYLFHPAHKTYGIDFFYYRSLAELSRSVSGPAFYHAGERLVAIEVNALGKRLREEEGWRISDSEVHALVMRNRRIGGEVPIRYYPEWTQIREMSTNEYSKVSPLTFGLVRALGLDQRPWREAYRIWNFVALAALLGGLEILRRTAGFRSIAFPWWATVALWFDPCRSAFVYGQFMEITFLLLAILFWAEKNSHAALSGAALGASLALKPLALGLVVYLVWKWLFVPSERRRAVVALGTACGTAVGLLLGAEILLGAGITLEWLRSLPSWYATYDYTIVSFANRSAMSALSSWLGLPPSSPGLTQIFGAWILAVTAVYALLFLGAFRRSARPQNLAPAAAALLGVFLVSKFVLIQYELLLLIPFAVALSRVVELEIPVRRVRLGLLLLAWAGIGFFESFDFLLTSRLEWLLYPILLMQLAAPTPSFATAEPASRG
jgi:hypothetical protein